MTAHRSDMKAILVGGEVGGDKGKDLGRNAVDMSKGVLPLANSCQCD